MFDEAISEAWQQAAIELGVRIVAPFECACDGRSAVCEAFVPDFGSPDGAIVISNSNDDLRDLIRPRWVSVCFEPYRTYERDLFADTLNDWQWFGPEGQAPAWYRGASWS